MASAIERKIEEIQKRINMRIMGQRKSQEFEKEIINNKNQETRQKSIELKDGKRKSLEITKNDSKKSIELKKDDTRKSVELKKDDTRKSVELKKDDTRKSMELKKDDTRKSVEISKNDSRKSIELKKDDTRKSMEVKKDDKRKSMEVKKDEPQKNAENVEKPANYGKRWTVEEQEDLLNEIKENKTYEEIAEIHQRSPGGVAAKLMAIAHNMHKEKIDMNIIAKKTKLDIDKIKEFIQKKDKIEASKQIPKENLKESKILINIKNELTDIKKLLLEFKNVLHIFNRKNKND